jgi:putative holliday junction resolvase
MTEHVCAMAFDYGSHHIGVAVGQSVTGTATPLETVAVRDGKPNFDRIEALIREWQPNILVVGDPLTMDGTVQEMTVAARRFGRRLHGRYRLPVEAADERLSSMEARRSMAEYGAWGEPDHPHAARVILETWFAERDR